jgi:hypothetical protein
MSVQGQSRHFENAREFLLFSDQRTWPTGCVRSKKMPNPEVAARKTHQRLQEFSFATPKRLLQQSPPEADPTTDDGRGLHGCY